MNLARSVELVRHYVDLKAKVALKTNRSVFNATLALRCKQEATSKTPKSECKNCFSTTKQKANS